MNGPMVFDGSEFLNALQLCLKHRVVGISGDTPSTRPHAFRVHFAQVPTDDPGLRFFERLVPGQWITPKVYRFECDAERLFPRLTNVLLLTRLQPQNIRALATLDPQYAAVVQQLGLETVADTPSTSLDSLAAARKATFASATAQQLTLRAIAEASGLTQVTISKFKAGGDIMLSNFFKIAVAVGLRITAQPVATTNRDKRISQTRKRPAQ